MHSRSNTKWSVVSSFMISARVCNPYERFCSVLLTIESSLVLRATSNLLMSQQRPRTICSKQSSRRSRPYYKRKRRKISSNQHYKEPYESYIPKGIILIHPRLDLVNVIVRPFLFTKLSLFTKSSLDKE